MRQVLIIATLFFWGSLTAQTLPKNSMQIKPNPANQKATIELPNMNLTQCQVQLFTMLGTPINGVYIQSQPFEHKIQLLFPDIPEGIYLVRVKNGDIELTQRLKIQR